MISLAASAERWAKRPHLGRHHCKAAARITRARRLHACVQSQQVGLERDLVNHADDLADLLGGLLDAAHGLDRLAHHLAALLGIILGRGDHLAGVAGALGGLLDGGGDLLERGGRLFQARGLLLGAPRQIIGRRGDLSCSRADALHAGNDGEHRLLKLVNGSIEVGSELLGVGRKRSRDLIEQISVRQPVEALGERCDCGLRLTRLLGLFELTRRLLLLRLFALLGSVPL